MFASWRRKPIRMSAHNCIWLFSTRAKPRLRVIDQPNESRSDLASVMAKERWLAGRKRRLFRPAIQAGRITDQRRSNDCALPSSENSFRSVERGQRTGAIATRRGIFDERKDQRGGAMRAVSRRSLATGGGPGRFGERAPSVRRDRKGKCDRAGLLLRRSRSQNFRSVLTLGKIMKDFRIERALNLDGGSSSAFWFRIGRRTIFDSRAKNCARFCRGDPEIISHIYARASRTK